mgnify:CR=1 FL=1
MKESSRGSYWLEPASAEDRLWLYQLYEESLRPVIDEAVGWDDEDQRRRFGRSYEAEKFQLITQGSTRAGALYTIAQPENLHLSLLLIHEDFRNRSLGTQIIEDIQKEQAGGPITLSVFKNNPAVSFYKRLGFRVDVEDEYFLEMSWRP